MPFRLRKTESERSIRYDVIEVNRVTAMNGDVYFRKVDKWNDAAEVSTSGKTFKDPTQLRLFAEACLRAASKLEEAQANEKIHT
jgi:hypothetical protein